MRRTLLTLFLLNAVFFTLEAPLLACWVSEGDEEQLNLRAVSVPNDTSGRSEEKLHVSSSSTGTAPRIVHDEKEEGLLVFGQNLPFLI
jgi:hypothetical protein